MLKSLTIKNLILIESCHIELRPGLNILTGETGTGKTAFIHAIALALGQRTESSIIRQGQTKASIEASFDIHKLPHLQALLNEKGIDHDSSELLIIRRELSKEGKSRCFINNQMATLALLQEVGFHLIDLIGQHSYHLLKQASFARELIDQFGDLSALSLEFKTLFQQEIKLADALHDLIHKEAKRESELDLYKLHLKELEEAPSSDEEEEQLFEEYSKHAHHKETAEILHQLEGFMTDPDTGLAMQLKKAFKTLSSLSTKNAQLKDASALLEQSLVSYVEASSEINKVTSSIEFDPHEFQRLEKRLSTIERLKRKYGKTLSEMQSYKDEVKEKLQSLENLELQIDALTEELKTVSSNLQSVGETLSAKRRSAAALLEETLTSLLQSFNMPGASVQFRFEPQQKSSYGKESLSLWMRTNSGENYALVKDTASGGELSRLLLSIKVALFTRNLSHTIIFDEIDANVGGETAGLIAEKLAYLGLERQVICITHFPQVAIKASHHFRAIKIAVDGRMQTFIESLDAEGKQKELLRMVGGNTDVLIKPTN